MRYFIAVLFIAFSVPAWAQYDSQAEWQQRDMEHQREDQIQQEQQDQYNRLEQQQRQMQYELEHQDRDNSTFYDYAPR